VRGENDAPLILASGSARRRDLLREAGFRFRVLAPEIEEATLPGESPETRTRRLAIQKAEAVARRSPPGSWILAADTVVLIDHETLGKPRDIEEAASMLLRLAGRAHVVITGFALARAGEEPLRAACGIEASRVHMRAVSRPEALAYATTGEPMDKAGAYALQGIGARFVEEVEGSRSNVVGLPLERVIPLLERHGIRPRETCAA
jgi:septum formation protein